jgi:hypothetical protein
VDHIVDNNASSNTKIIEDPVRRTHTHAGGGVTHVYVDHARARRRTAPFRPAHRVTALAWLLTLSQRRTVPAVPLTVDLRFSQRSEGASCCERSRSDRSTLWAVAMDSEPAEHGAINRGRRPVPERVRFTSIVSGGRSDRLARVPISLPFASTATRRHHVDVEPDLGRPISLT